MSGTSTTKVSKPHLFQKGWKGGPGNPYAAQVQKLREGALNVLTPEIMAGIMTRAAADALKGDHHAREFVFDRALGKAVAPVVVAEGQPDFLRDFFQALRSGTSDADEARRIEARVIDVKPANGKKNGHAKKP